MIRLMLHPLWVYTVKRCMKWVMHLVAASTEWRTLQAPTRLIVVHVDGSVTCVARFLSCFHQQSREQRMSLLNWVTGCSETAIVT